MNVWILILQFLVLMAVVTGAIIFFLHRYLVSSTDGAVKRLNTETETVRGKQTELNKKIKEADEELARRQKEASELAKKMKDEAEESLRAEREKTIKKAREDGEEIIARAQRTKDQIRQEILKEMELKTIDFSIKILNTVISESLRGVLDQHLSQEFLKNLEKMDMNQVSIDVYSADIITAVPADGKFKDQLIKIVKSKINRDVTVNETVDPNIGGGVILKFGTLSIDGSLFNLLKDTGISLKQKIERGET